MALSADRNTPMREGVLYDYPVAADTVIYAGSLIVLDADGNAEPASTATGLVAVGRAEQHVDNGGGAATALTVRVRQGVFRWANSADADAITKAEIGSQCYIVDDQTVAKTSGDDTRSVAGTVVDVDAQGVWVKTSF